MCVCVCVCVCVQLDVNLIFFILFKTSLPVLGIPCPTSGDLILPGQPSSWTRIYIYIYIYFILLYYARNHKPKMLSSVTVTNTQYRYSCDYSIHQQYPILATASGQRHVTFPDSESDPMESSYLETSLRLWWVGNIASES
jgi:hypothetical protein